MFAKLENDNPTKAKELREKCQMDDGELGRFKKAAENMYLAYDKENDMYMQDDNFIYKDPIDIDNIPVENLPLLVNMHPLNLWRYQVIKQADIVLLMGLYANEFSKEMKKKVFDFYESHTIHDSSLSAGVHSIVACDIGYEEEAYGYLKQACRMDLDNVNRNVAVGVHAACMGSSYLIIVNGYAGLSIYENTLHFAPKIPENWNSYSFHISFKGSLLYITITKEKTMYELKGGKAIEFYHKDTKVKLDENEGKIEII
jgi:alpha,alpha-trehalose phosphorylase